MLRIVDRYLLKEIIHSWLAVTLILWLILVSQRLVRYLADAVAGELPGDVIFLLLGVKTIWYLVYVMPFSLALGVVLGLGRMCRDSEMIVLGACGIGPGRLYQPLLGLGVVTAVMLGWLALYVNPGISEYGYQLEKHAEQRADITSLGAGRFNEIRQGEMTFYAERLSEDKLNMENLFIYVSPKEGGNPMPQVLTAKSAYRMTDEETGDNFLVLVDGYRFEGTPGEAKYRMMEFGQYGVRIELPGIDISTSQRSGRPTSELLASGTREDAIELQWRLSVPVSVLVLIFLAVPLSSHSPRQSRYGQLVIAVLIFVIYFNLLGTAKAWVEQGTVPVMIGIWWVHLLPVILAAALLNRDKLIRLVT